MSSTPTWRSSGRARRFPDGDGLTDASAGSTRRAKFDRKARVGNRLASTMGTTARPCQARASPERIPAVLTDGRLQHEAAHPVTSKRSGDVHQMIFNVAFWEPDQCRQFGR